VAKPKAPAQKRGRPTKRTPAVIKTILDGLSRGTPLTVICAPDNMPHDDTVRKWEVADPIFSAEVARARARGHDALAAECLAIADEKPDRVITYLGDNKSESRVDSGAVAHAKLRIWTRQQLLAKWDPKRYGELLKLANADGTNIDLTGRIQAARERAKNGE